MKHYLIMIIGEMKNKKDACALLGFNNYANKIFDNISNGEIILAHSIFLTMVLIQLGLVHI